MVKYGYCKLPLIRHGIIQLHNRAYKQGAYTRGTFDHLRPDWGEWGFISRSLRYTTIEREIREYFYGHRCDNVSPSSLTTTNNILFKISCAFLTMPGRKVSAVLHI